MLTKSKLMELNTLMLGQGAPITKDFSGYNQVHYAKMSMLALKSEISDQEACTICKVLMTYTNTQLTNYAKDIKETLEKYQSSLNVVKVVDYNKETVSLSWNYNTRVSEFIKSLDRQDVKWTRPNGNWVLNIAWNKIQGLLDKFTQENYVIDQITLIKGNLDNMDFGDSKTDVPKVPIEIKVTRPNKSIDTLSISCPYNKTVVDAFKRVPYMFYNKSNSTWEVYIEYSFRLWDELSGLSMDNLNFDSLKPWADLVQSWSKNYNLIDVSKLNLKFTPYEFQPIDSQKLLENKWMLNANEMGCGKTFEQVIIGESLPMKKLVICPPTLRLNWRKEILNVNPKAKVHIIYSNQQFETVDGWNIIGYTSLDKFSQELETENFQCIMIDEAHYCQAIGNSGEPESKRARSVLRLAATANYVYPITGTPKTNRNKNLFNILRLIRHPLTRGKWAFSNYGRIYCDGKKGSWGWDYEGNSNDEQLFEQLKPFMVRHLKKDVLPNLKKQRIMTPVQVDLSEYNYEISQYLQNRENKNGEDLARLMRARKILATQKVGESIDFAKTLITEDKKVVIVTCFTEVVNAIEQTFKGNVVKIVGGMSDKAKDTAVTQFQEGEPQILVMNIIAGGVGITLTKSYNMIVNDFDWVSGNHMQAEDRICRGGQTEEYCNIFYLYAEGADMDEVMADTLSYKSQTISNVVDGGDGDTFNFMDMLDKALEKSTGIRKTRKIVKVEEPKVESQPKTNKTNQNSNVNNSSIDFKGMTIEQLWTKAREVNADCKVYTCEKIQRMRLIMAIKSALQI